MDSEPKIKPKEIGKQDIKLDPPPVDGTSIVIQRHEAYIRDKQDPNTGSLTPIGQENANEQAYNTVMNMLQKMTPEEREQLSFMVFASPTQYDGKGRRSMETGAEIIKGITHAFEKEGVSEFRLLNSQERLPFNGGPIPSGIITEPKMFEKTPEFVDWLASKHGNMTKEFWIAYEDDLHEVRERRLEMGAEGPSDMADRLENFLQRMKLFSDTFHAKNPNRRLVLWAVTHYDTISPYIKSRIGSENPSFLPVDYGGGFVINIDPNGNSSTKIGDQNYRINTEK